MLAPVSVTVTIRRQYAPTSTTEIVGVRPPPGKLDAVPVTAPIPTYASLRVQP